MKQQTNQKLFALLVDQGTKLAPLSVLSTQPIEHRLRWLMDTNRYLSKVLRH